MVLVLRSFKQSRIYNIVNRGAIRMVEKSDLGYCQVRGNGQITIPAETREFLKIDEGDTVAFFPHPEGVLMVKADVIVMKRSKN
jgi:AbrB family looped-hinge helix DNA binding protein